MLVGGSTNSVFGYSAQSFKANDTSSSVAAGSKGGSEDEYVASGTSSGAYRAYVPGNKTEATAAQIQYITPTLESEIGIDLNAAPLFSLDLYSQEKIDAASAHKSPIAWALGLNAIDSLLTFGVDKAQLTEKIKATSQGLDEKIAAALKSNNITLGKNEKLSLSVNNKGEVTVADGVMGKTRAEDIQKALNQDSSIGQDMLLSHAQRSIMNTGIKSNAADSNSTAILFDQLLQREYGVSLSDFSRNTNHSDQYGVKNYSISSESGGEELVASLYDNERALYHKIESYVNQVHDDPDSASFEYGFSYSNGILVENGQTDASGMKEQARDILHRAMLVDSADFSVELDAEGNYIRSNVNQVQGADSSYARQLNQRLTSFFARPEGWLNNMTTGTNGVTKLFSFDSMRLLQYNLGEDAKELTDFKAVIAGSIK